MRKYEANLVLLAVILFVFLVALPQQSAAIPAFARQYNTSCTTCHSDFPKLNDFGKAFKDAGFKFPKDDEDFIKIPNVLLGAPAQKDLWPHSVWPGSIPGLPPIGLRMNNFFQVLGRNRGTIGNALNPAGAVSPFIPRTDFETGFFSIFTAGNFGGNIAFWVDDDISIAGANSNGGLGDGYLKFVNLGGLFKLPTDSFSVRAGQFELDLPFTQARSYNLSPYDIYQQASLGAINALFPQQNVNNTFAFAGAAQGIEVSGGHTNGGYHYSLAVVNQHTGGAVGSPDVVPSATGGASGGGTGFTSDSNFKDLYGRFSYRFNLEKDTASRNAVQAAGPTGPRDHTSLNLGSYYFYGRSVQRFSGADLTGSPLVLTAREPFYRVGGDFNFNYRKFNTYGLFMYGHDHNLLPIDAAGVLIALPITAPAVPVAFVRGVPATFAGGFVQADYLAFPWLMAIMRWDTVNSNADRLNGLGLIPGGSFFAPFNNTRNRFTPGVQFLIHANIKASAEYQIRPQQSVTSAINPLTGLPIAISPFRTNALTLGLEFVY